LFVIAILQNGLRLSAAPAELAGILTGALLIGTILLDWLSKRSRARGSAETGEIIGEEIELKNSQLAFLSAVIIFAALIVAGSNWYLARSFQHERAAGNPSGGASSVTGNGRKTVVAMMPKAKGDPYFISCRQGAEEAAKEFGVELLWDGPTE